MKKDKRAKKRNQVHVLLCEARTKIINHEAKAIRTKARRRTCTYAGAVNIRIPGGWRFAVCLFNMLPSAFFFDMGRRETGNRLLCVYIPLVIYLALTGCFLDEVSFYFFLVVIKYK